MSSRRLIGLYATKYSNFDAVNGIVQITFFESRYGELLILANTRLHGDSVRIACEFCQVTPLDVS